MANNVGIALNSLIPAINKIAGGDGCYHTGCEICMKKFAEIANRGLRKNKIPYHFEVERKYVTHERDDGTNFRNHVPNTWLKKGYAKMAVEQGSPGK